MERNITLDYFKIVLSILVITIHLPPLISGESLLSWFISNGVARIAVPCFFIINGYYFSPKTDNPKAIKKYMFHLGTVYLVWFAIYLRPFLYQTKQLFILHDFRIDLILESLFWGFFHLWYLPALIFGILIFLLFKKIIKKDLIILAIGVILFSVGYFIEPIKESLHEVRNGLFFGFPFIVLGHCIRSMNLLKKLKGRYIELLFLFSLIALIIESYLCYKSGLARDMYLSLLIVCPSAFLLILKYSKYKAANKYTDYLGLMSSAIYFVHVYVIFKLFAFTDFSPLQRFLIVLPVTIIISIIIITINKRIKIFL